MLGDAELDKENSSVRHGANNHKVPEMNDMSKRKFVLRFGDSKFASDMHVAQIKAIYGKHVKEGKLTLEDKMNVKVLIKATPAECQRLMKTLTTLKGAPKEAQNAHLASLGCCAKCASKNAASKVKAEERQQKIVAAQLAQAEAELARKRKREEAEKERDGDKVRKLSEQLQRVEEMRAAKEAAKEDIEAAKRRIEEKRQAAREEKDKLRVEGEALAETRRAHAAERKELEAMKKELERFREEIARDKTSLDRAQELLGAHLKAHESTLKSLEVARQAVERERAVIVKERERVELETVKYEEQLKAAAAKKAAWEDAMRYRADETAYKAATAERKREEAAAKKDETTRREAERDATAERKAARVKARQDTWAKDYEKWETTGASSGAPEYPRDDSASPSTSPTGASPDAARFYGGSRASSKAKPSKPVIDDDDEDGSPEHTKEAKMDDEEKAAREAREFAAAEAHARELARKRQEELARQARERLAAERAEAAAEKNLQRKQNSKKAQKVLLEEMRRKQEEEAAQREHHARQAQTEQKIREKARSTCVATATDAIYEAHVAAFEKMKTAPPGTLRERDIPWPLPNNLVFMTPRDDQNAKKKKVMRAIQRWHPDKFTQNFGACIYEAEREQIMTRVRGVSASVIELRQVWN